MYDGGLILMVKSGYFCLVVFWYMTTNRGNLDIKPFTNPMGWCSIGIPPEVLHGPEMS